MARIIISAWLDFADEEARDRAVALTAPIQLATREEEEGCLDYCFAADPAISNRIQVYELWEDEEALAFHFKHHTYKAMSEALQGVGIVYTENQMYLIAKQEPVYGENNTPREKFFVD